jgi:hypothetical protein
MMWKVFAVAFDRYVVESAVDENDEVVTGV